MIVVVVERKGGEVKGSWFFTSVRKLLWGKGAEKISYIMRGGKEKIFKEKKLDHHSHPKP